jgi:hypothetical protein
MQLDDLRRRGVLFRQSGEGLVQGEDLLGRGSDRHVLICQRHVRSAAAVLDAGLAPGAFDEDAAHRLSGRSEEVPAAVPVQILTPADQAQVGFVDQGGRLKCFIGLLVGELRRRQLAQLVVDQRQQLLGGVRIARRGGRQDARDLVHWRHLRCWSMRFPGL